LDQHQRPSSQLQCSNCERIPQRTILFSQSDTATGDLEIFAGLLCHSYGNNRFCIDSQCPSLLSLGGDATLDAVLEWIRPEVSRLVGFRRQSRRSFFFAPVYLNADFTGGELVFPDVDVVIIPKPGLLVGFPSNH
jgi:hypothetical protein